MARRKGIELDVYYYDMYAYMNALDSFIYQLTISPPKLWNKSFKEKKTPIIKANT